MNIGLTNDGVGIYSPVVFALYRGLFEDCLQSCSNCDLFRGTIISTQELNQIQTNFNRIPKNNSNFLLFFSKRFLSFTKDKEVSKAFLQNGMTNKNSQQYRPVLFTVNKCFSSKKLISNIDLKQYTEFPDEQEVLYLPLSSFVIKNIINQNDFTEIQLDNIAQYHKEFINHLNYPGSDAKIRNYMRDNVFVNVCQFLGKQFSQDQYISMVYNLRNYS